MRRHLWKWSIELRKLRRDSKLRQRTMATARSPEKSVPHVPAGDKSARGECIFGSARAACVKPPFSYQFSTFPSTAYLLVQFGANIVERKTGIIAISPRLCKSSRNIFARDSYERQQASCNSVISWVCFANVVVVVVIHLQEMAALLWICRFQN